MKTKLRRTLIPIVAIILFCAFISPWSLGYQKPGAKGVVMSLDNFGGFSHGGRRLELMMDGRFLETSYTDVVGDRRNKSSGNYAIDQTKAALHLSHATGAVEVLFKVDYGGVEFWVKEEKRKLIQEPGEKWLRQTSLRRVK